MKILYHHRIASKDGMYVHVEELTKALIEQGNTIDFVCPDFTRETSFGDDGGIVARLRSWLPKPAFELLELSYSLVVAARLFVAILKKRPDFIYERYNLHQPMGVIVASLFDIPILLEVNSPLAAERREHSGLALYDLARVVEEFTWRNATYVLPVTRVLADILRESGVPEDKIRVVPNGVDEKKLGALPAPALAVATNNADALASGLPPKELVIGFTGFMHPWHRLDIAIDALAQFNDRPLRLLCVGEGEIRPELEALARELGVEDRVEFTGLVSRAEIYDYVRQFDIAIQPSVTAYASPLKLFEYLAVGSLVVAPRTPNILEILNDDNAVLFDIDREGDFAAKLKYAIENIEELYSRRVRARETIDEKNLTWQDNARLVQQLAMSNR
jgi:glycosyltransferase involved in cell wall biosynthesis